MPGFIDAIRARTNAPVTINISHIVFFAPQDEGAATEIVLLHGYVIDIAESFVDFTKRLRNQYPTRRHV